MYSEIYIDVVFLVNLFMDYILLRLIGRLFSAGKRKGRYLGAAAVGALFSCVMVYFLDYTGNSGTAEKTAGILLHGICAVFMLRIGPGFRKNGLLLKGVLLLYLTAFLAGGFLEAVAEKHADSPAVFLSGAAGIYLGMGGLGIWSDCLRARMKNLYAVTFLYQGRKYETCGFYDTGNLLCDPLTGKAVSVIRAEALLGLLSKDCIEKLKYIMADPGELENTDLFRLKPHVVPFCSVGESSGLLVAITLDELDIHTPKEVVRIQSPVLALLYAPATLGSEYEVLLNSRLLE